MSASTRGMVIGCDGTRLVVEATPVDVARFVLGQTADVLQEMTDVRAAIAQLVMDGWQVVPGRNNGDWFHYRQGERPSSCAALLRTRCGCERVMPVAYPPSDLVRVAIQDHLQALTGLEVGELSPFAVRTFRRTGRASTVANMLQVEYLEEGS